MEEMELISELTPHFQRALRIQKEFTRLKLQQNILSAGLSHISLGVILLNNTGLPCFINPVAEKLLSNHPAIRLGPNGNIKICDQQQDTEFQTALIKLLADDTPKEEDSYAFGLRTSETSHPLAMLLTSHDAGDIMKEWPSFENKGAVIYLSDPASSSFISCELLKKSYNLSEAESEVAIGLTNGLTLDQIAESNKVSINTIRSQLRSVFQKTGTSRQAELVNLLLSLRI